ncbi:MAG: glycosyltransferase family 2 protein [Desulfobacca sp.]|nr:glycosyltransferase family 2 protein [Desulfobacca sp.]
MNPLVSVIMAAYNAGNFIGSALNSVLGQTYSNFELIIVDDASTDNTRGIIESYNDPRLVIIRNTKNLKPAAARNIAIDAAHGKYIALCDADDLCMPSRLKVQVNYLETHIEIDVVGSNAYVFDAAGTIIGGLVLKGTDHQALIKNINWDIPLIHPSIMARATWFKKYRYRDTYHRAQDRELFFRSYKDSIFANIPEFLYAYRDPGRINPKKLFWNNWYEIHMRWRHWQEYQLPKTSVLAFLPLLAGRLSYYGILAALGKSNYGVRLKQLERNPTFHQNQHWLRDCLIKNG